jgi:hypothetical protein
MHFLFLLSVLVLRPPAPRTIRDSIVLMKGVVRGGVSGLDYFRNRPAARPLPSIPPPLKPGGASTTPSPPPARLARGSMGMHSLTGEARRYAGQARQPGDEGRPACRRATPVCGSGPPVQGSCETRVPMVLEGRTGGPPWSRPCPSWPRPCTTRPVREALHGLASGLHARAHARQNRRGSLSMVSPLPVIPPPMREKTRTGAPPWPRLRAQCPHPCTRRPHGSRPIASPLPFIPPPMHAGAHRSEALPRAGLVPWLWGSDVLAKRP